MADVNKMLGKDEKKGMGRKRGDVRDIDNKGTNQSEIKDVQKGQADFPSKSNTTRDENRPTYSWYLNVVSMILACVF